MVRKIIVGVLLGVILLGGAVAYSFLRPTTGASGPIQTIPIAQEAAAAGTTIFEIQSEASQVRFTIDEVLRGAPTKVVGTTNQVAGQIAVNASDPDSTTLGPILINARTFATDSDQRNRAIQNRILSTDQYEYITFTPRTIAGLPDQASPGAAYTFQVVGTLTIRDVTRDVTFDVNVTPVSESRLEGQASTTIRYRDWNLSIPEVPFVADVSEEVQVALDFVATARS